MFLERPFEKPSVLLAPLEIESLSGREGWLAPASRSLGSTLSIDTTSSETVWKHPVAAVPPDVRWRPSTPRGLPARGPRTLPHRRRPF